METTYRTWWRDRSDPIYFSQTEGAEMARRFDFDLAQLQPGCGIKFRDADGDVIGGIIDAGREWTIDAQELLDLLDGDLPEDELR